MYRLVSSRDDKLKVRTSKLVLTNQGYPSFLNLQISFPFQIRPVENEVKLIMFNSGTVFSTIQNIALRLITCDVPFS
jgi:hypothetical protein